MAPETWDSICSSESLLNLFVEETMKQLDSASMEDGWLRSSPNTTVSPARDLCIWSLGVLLACNPMAAISVYTVPIFNRIADFVVGKQIDGVWHRRTRAAIGPFLPLLGILVSRVCYFETVPDLSRLDWLREEMETCYARDKEE